MPVVNQVYVPALGDYALSIALDHQPIGRRDQEVWVGDQSSLVLTIYQADGDVDPITDYSNITLTLRVGMYQVFPDSTIEGIPTDGGEVVFDMSGVDFSRYWGRTRFTIRMVEDARTKTVAQGFIVVEGNSNPEAWPNDYGFSHWGGW